jgi:hypothetical protein
VESVLTQEDVDLQVIVVDDASTDDSRAVAEDLAAQDARVEIVLHHKNIGHIATYNDGLERVTGDYCALLSADDLLVAGALARAAALLEEFPDVGMAYGARVPFEDVLPSARTSVEGWSVWSGAEWVDAVCRLGTNVLASPEVLMRTSVQRAIGGYRPELPHSGDLEMWLRAAAVADVGRVRGADHAYYRQHASSMSRSVYYPVALSDLRARKAAFAGALEPAPTTLPSAAVLHRRAQRSMSSEALDMATAMQRGGAPRAEIEAAVAFAASTHPGSKHWLRYLLIGLRSRLSTGRAWKAAEPFDRLASRARRRYVRVRRAKGLDRVASV